MTRETFNYTHGDTGTEPSSGIDFVANQRPNPANFDWYWYNTIEAIKGHADEFDRLDSNDDGIVDEADEADTLDGLHASDISANVSDGGTTVVTDATDINFGSNIDVTDDGDGTVTIDGTPGYTDSDARNAVNGSNITAGGLVVPVGTDKWV